MSTKTLLLVAVVVIIVAAGGLYFFTKPNNLAPNISPSSTSAKKVAKPSETYIEYTDPSGFSFNYPDNVSIEKKESEDPNTYADLQLFSKDVSGSLSIRITDTKLKRLEDWAKEASVSGSTPKEVMLGNLKAREIKTKDRLMLGAIDQGVLFSIDMPLIEEDFWTKVYGKVLADFSFAAPEMTTAAGISGGSTEEVVFEAEEVVE